MKTLTKSATFVALAAAGIVVGVAALAISLAASIAVWDGHDLDSGLK